MNVQSATAIANYYQQSTASSAVNVAQALSAVKLNPRAKFTLQDSAANIESNFTSLAAIVNNVSSVTLTDQSNSFITITAKQLLTPSAAALTNKMNLGGSNKVSLNVVDALAKDVATLKPASSNKIGQLSIKDTSTNIAAKFDSLAAFENKLGNIQQIDPAKFVKITNAQYSASSDVRNHFTGTFHFEVSGVNTSLALEIQYDDNVAKVNIVDSAQNISDNLDALQDMGLKVNTIKSDDTLFKVTADQLKKDGAVIGKIYKGYQLAVFNIDAGTALTVKSNKKIVSLDIVDTAEGISKNLALLGKLGTQLHSLQITDGKPLALTAKAYFQSDATLKKVVNDPNSNGVKIDSPVDPIADPNNANFNNTYELDILESTAVDAIAIKNDPRIHSISIKDTSSAISANLNSLNAITDSDGASLIQDIGVVGNNNLINLTIDQLTNDGVVVSLLKTNNGNLKFNVKGVAASDAKALLNDPDNRVASVSVSDTAENIVGNLSDLASLGKNLSTITQTDARVQGSQGVALNLSATDWMLNIGSLSKIVGGYGVNLKDVGAAKALSLANDARVKSFEVLDSAAEISSNFDTLKTLGTKLTSIKQSDTGTAIEITGRQYSTQGNILSKLEGSYKLSVNNAQASQVTSFIQDKTHLSSVQVIDTVENITGNLDAIQEAAITVELGSSIKVSMSGTPKPFTLSVSDLENYQDAFNVIQDNYKVNLKDVEATDAKALVEDESKPVHSHLLSMTVKASASDLSDKDLVANLNSLGNKISQVNQKDVGEIISISQADWESNRNLFAKINGYQVSLTEVAASGAKNLLINEHVANVNVVDTGSQISLNFGTLMDLGPSVSSIKQPEDDSSNLQLSMELWKTGSDTLEKIENDYKVDLLGATASDAGTVSDETTVNSVQIKDSSLEISTNFDSLVSNDKISNIVLTGAVAPIKLTQSQLTDGSALLGKIQGSYSLAISDASVSAASDLIANTHIVSAEMSGSSTDISGSLSVLSQFGPKLKSLSLTDDNPSMSLTFANFQKYKNVLGLIPQNFKIDLTEVKASDAVNQGLDTQFNLSFSVKDSAAQIASNIDGLTALKSKLSSITSNEGTPVLTLKASQYLANQDVLAKVNTGADSPYKLVLTGGNIKFAQNVLSDAAQAGKINSLDITDSAENISNNFATISDSKVLTARLTAGSSTLSLSGDQYANSSTLAKVKGTFDINVSDASLGQTAAMQADSRVNSYSLDATSSAIGTTLPAVLDLSKLDQINITQDATAMSVSLANYVLVEDKLNKLVGNFGLNVTDVEVSDLDSLSNKNEISSIQILDTSENISENWDQLVGLGDKLKSIQNSTTNIPVAITFDQYGTSAATLAKFSTTQSLALLEVTPDQATSAAGENNVATVSVLGSAEQVASNFESLVALGTKLDSIELTDSNALELTQAQYNADLDEATLKKINGPHDLVILE